MMPWHQKCYFLVFMYTQILHHHRGSSAEAAVRGAVNAGTLSCPRHAAAYASL